MSCAYDCMKWILFLINFLFVLLGAAILGIGIWVHLELNDYEKVTNLVGTPALLFIIIGAIVFVISFFGCCGAIRESHCMVVTYAVFLLTILVIQVAIGVWVFVQSKDMKSDVTTTDIANSYRKEIFNNYWTDEGDRLIVDSAQSGLKCCGVTSSSDFSNLAATGNNTIPWSCCGNPELTACTISSDIYSSGCASKLTEVIEKYAKIIGGILIGVAATELVGIIFALCLANSIRNDERRGYRV